jgi:hypothetical protein
MKSKPFLNVLLVLSGIVSAYMTNTGSNRASDVLSNSNLWSSTGLIVPGLFFGIILAFQMFNIGYNSKLKIFGWVFWSTISFVAIYYLGVFLTIVSFGKQVDSSSSFLSSFLSVFPILGFIGGFLVAAYINLFVAKSNVWTTRWINIFTTSVLGLLAGLTMYLPLENLGLYALFVCWQLAVGLYLNQTLKRGRDQK